MLITKLIAKQLHRPSGLLAGFTGWSMNKMNWEMNAFTVQHLNIQPHHSVLDIGFGGGISLNLITQAAYDGLVAGIEISEAMLSQARIRYTHCLKEARLELTKGSIEQIPYPNEQFDRVCTVNTVYFWSDPEASTAEVFRVLKSGGLFALCFRPREDMESLKFTKYGFNLYSSEDIVFLLKKACYTVVELSSLQDQHLGFVCVIARKD